MWKWKEPKGTDRETKIVSSTGLSQTTLEQIVDMHFDRISYKTIARRLKLDEAVVKQALVDAGRRSNFKGL